MSLAQAELFPSPQGDLFGAPESGMPTAYVVPYRIALNTLRGTLETLASATAWPWDADMKAAKMDRGVPKLLAALPDEEAAVWRARFAAEAARLDAARRAA